MRPLVVLTTILSLISFGVAAAVPAELGVDNWIPTETPQPSPTKVLVTRLRGRSFAEPSCLTITRWLYPDFAPTSTVYASMITVTAYYDCLGCSTLSIARPYLTAHLSAALAKYGGKPPVTTATVTVTDKMTTVAYLCKPTPKKNL
ncbi:hypothetical protein Dda_8214 [Drechslerella dactyloides]|uniref:Uncharacterized protein n=1 Tax=Drechslerella dactyloides TaxID=74499 RepID=A0AAD6ITF9_DREDA|nr:hypothetical protein Dda_8214 [Drechslerella dactyloides]